MKKNLLAAIKKYQDGRLSKRELIRKLTPEILKIPALFGYFNQDLRHDFFAKVLSQIDRIIMQYNEVEGAKFTTWLNIVLKRRFINYIKEWSRNNKEENHDAYRQLREESAIFFTEEAYRIPVENSNSFNFDLSILTKKEKNVLAHKFGFPINGQDVSQTIEKIIEKMNKKKVIEERIAAKHSHIIKIQHNIAKSDCVIEKEKLKSLETRTIYSKRRLEKAFSTFSILPQDHWVAEKLGLATGTISAHLHNIKKKLAERHSVDFIEKSKNLV